MAQAYRFKFLTHGQERRIRISKAVGDRWQKIIEVVQANSIETDEALRVRANTALTEYIALRAPRDAFEALAPVFFNAEGAPTD